MYKDSQTEIKVRKRIRTYYCDCCNKELDTVENCSRFDEDEGFPCSYYSRTIRVQIDTDTLTNVKGIICDNCWADVKLHIGKMIDEACEKFSYKKEDFNMNHKDMTCTKAKDLLENYIHTEFFDRKDTDLGQAMVKAIVLLEKESKLEEKYSDKNAYNYHNAPKRFLHCPVCDYNRKHDKYGHNEYHHDININECPQCWFSVIILRTDRNRSSNISDAMRRTCWNKVCELYKNGAKNGTITIPWQTYYANSMKTENLHVKYGFDVDNMLKTWDVKDI